jgi:hypothetical protein
MHSPTFCHDTRVFLQRVARCAFVARASNIDTLLRRPAASALHPRSPNSFTPSTLPLPHFFQAARSGSGGPAAAAPAAMALTLEVAGWERVDPSWVATLYQPHVPAQKEAKARTKGRGLLFFWF